MIFDNSKLNSMLKGADPVLIFLLGDPAYPLMPYTCIMKAYAAGASSTLRELSWL